MPARLEELHHAKEEGIELMCLHAPLSFQGDSQGRLASVVLQKMRLGDPDDSGRCRPLACEGEFCEVSADMAIVAVGTRANPLLPRTTPGLLVNAKGYITINEHTGETTIPHVFAGGDIVTGAATVISAMGAGRRAAAAIAELF